jgi:formamidopyrimidine-DNA glycosylase
LIYAPHVPELPEVETVRRTLAPVLQHHTITRATLHRADICSTATGKRCRPADLLQGLTIDRLDRRGKQLAIVATTGRALLVHLGMSGSLRATAPGAKPKKTDHIHATWALDSGWRVDFRDPRRFGGLWTFPSFEEIEARWAALGPDGLRITGKQLAARCGRSRRPIKAALLDQGVVAGVGNIYADEALFAARIHPATLAAELTPARFTALAAAIRRVLRQAIAAGGSTIRDYIDARGQAGRAQERHAVYGRAGQPCLRCATPLESGTLGQRTTVHCPGCQPVWAP